MLASGQEGRTASHPFSCAVLPSLFVVIVLRQNAVCIAPFRDGFDLPPLVIALANQGYVDMSNL
jgi:hypothetical protein